jgi:protein Mpv17
LQVFITGGAFDMKRFITLSAFGFLYHGPSGHYFYNWLDKQVPGTEPKHVAMKVAFDQIVWW